LKNFNQIHAKNKVNIAVTWAVAVAGKMQLFMVPAYWAAQLLGGFIGSLIVRVSSL
jgi:glycerol uptake facilitator-like aquaporin